MIMSFEVKMSEGYFQAGYQICTSSSRMLFTCSDMVCSYDGHALGIMLHWPSKGFIVEELHMSMVDGATRLYPITGRAGSAGSDSKLQAPYTGPEVVYTIDHCRTFAAMSNNQRMAMLVF